MSTRVRISIIGAGTASFICLLLALGTSATLGSRFLYSVLALFAVSQSYTFKLKEEAFADVILIGINFVIRAASGAFIIDVIISPWLVVGVFFLALFLAVGKREADLVYLGRKARLHKKVLQYYTPKITNSLMNIATVLLIVSYSFYSFQSQHRNLFFTLPFALYVILRYYHLVSIGSDIARHPERGIKDIRLALGSLLWLTTTLLFIYF